MQFLHPDYDSLDWITRKEIMGSTHHLVLKLAHFTEFAFLGFLSSGLVAYLNRLRHKLRLWLEWQSRSPSACCTPYPMRSTRFFKPRSQHEGCAH